MYIQYVDGIYLTLTSVLSFLQAGDVPVEFEEFHLSEVQNMASEEKLDQVLTSMKTNKVAMKGNLSYYFVSACKPILHSVFKMSLLHLYSTAPSCTLY